MYMPQRCPENPWEAIDYVRHRSVGAMRCDRPLEALVPFQALIIDAGEYGCKRRDFVHHFGRMLVLPRRAKPIRYLLHDLPVRPAAFHRFENLVQPLDTPFRTGEGALFFQAGARRKHVGRP